MPPNGAHSLFGRYSRVSLQAATRTVAYAKSSVETDSVKQFKDIPGPLRLPLIGTLMPYKLGRSCIDCTLTFVYLVNLIKENDIYVNWNP